MILLNRYAIVTILLPRERKRFGVLLLLALLAALFEAVGISAVLPIMRLLQSSEYALSQPALRWLFDASGAGSYESFLCAMLIALVILFALKNLYLAAVYMLQARFVSCVEARLSTELLSAYLKGAYASRMGKHTADRVRIITSEVSRATSGYLMPSLVLATEGLVIIGLIVLLILLQPIAALVSITILGVAGAIIHKITNRHLENLREVRVDASVGMHKWAAESLGAIKETQSLGRENYFVELFAQDMNRYSKASAAFTLIGLTPRLVVETLAIASLLAGLAIGLGYGIKLEDLVPTLTVFGIAAVRVMPSATRVMSAVASLRFYKPSVSAVTDGLQSVPQELPRSRNALGKDEHLQELQLLGVTYRYPSADSPSLNDIHLNLRRGEVVAIIGRSGSGKTTLGDLLLGLLVPESGEIRINGRPVHRLASALRGVAGLVPQNFYMLDDTIRRNVAFGRASEEIDDKLVWLALKLASIDECVRALPGGLDTGVKEGGAMLSGGERQRLAIARALYGKPHILILDEATSSLDVDTEADIMRTLRSLSKDLIILMITHRLDNIVACDRVFVMRSGFLTNWESSRSHGID